MRAIKDKDTYETFLNVLRDGLKDYYGGHFERLFRGDVEDAIDAFIKLPECDQKHVLNVIKRIDKNNFVNYSRDFLEMPKKMPYFLHLGQFIHYFHDDVMEISVEQLEKLVFDTTSYYSDGEAYFYGAVHFNRPLLEEISKIPSDWDRSDAYFAVETRLRTRFSKDCPDMDGINEFLEGEVERIRTLPFNDFVHLEDVKTVTELAQENYFFKLLNSVKEKGDKPAHK